MVIVKKNSSINKRAVIALLSYFMHELKMVA